MSEPIKLDKEDVTIEELDPPTCSDCGEFQAEMIVFLDFRNAGCKVPISGPLCPNCAKALAERVKASL